MIQRIQSLYLLLSVICSVVCLCMPLGYFRTDAGTAQLFNLWLRTGEGEHVFSPWGLFAILILISTLTFMAIFLFTRRALQMRTCTLCMILLVGYYAYFVFFVLMHEGSFRPSFTAALPIVSLVLDFLAFRGILKDELLVKSLDRLR